MNNADITQRAYQMNYEMEDQPSHTDPESLLIEAETARLAGEDFEGYPLRSSDSGFKTPCSAREVVTAMCRRNAIREEDRQLSGDVGKKEELRWKRKVRRRAEVVGEEVPRKLWRFNN